MNPLIYDLEIIKAVPDKFGKRPNVPGVEYCAGWSDFANMGISTICAYDFNEQAYRVFLKDNFQEFADLTRERSPLVSFNGVRFDNLVLANCMSLFIDESKCYDILLEIGKAIGFGKVFEYPNTVGFSMNKVARANSCGGKSSCGESAPMNWQAGKFGAVIDYCLNDIFVTKRIFDRILATGELKDPRNGNILKLEIPV